MSDESCFTMDTVVWREVKKIISYRNLKTQKHSVSIGFPCSAFSFYEHLNRQFTYTVFYIQNHKMCFNKKILHQCFVFCPGRSNFTPQKLSHSLFLVLHYASMTLRTVPEKMLLSASAGGSVCKVMNLPVFIFFPSRFSCFLVSKMLDLQYIRKSKKIGLLTIDLETSKVSF